MATSTQAVSFSNIAANTATFVLKGGGYLLAASGTITSVQLAVLGPDGSTFITVGTALTAAGSTNVSVPAGTYRLNVTGTAIFAIVAGIPT
jgi:hypothetical protein